MSAPAPTAAPAPAPAPAAAPAASETPPTAPATTSAAPAPASTAPTAAPATATAVKPPPKQSTKDKLLGRKPADIEKQQTPEEEERDTKKRRRYAAVSVLGTFGMLIFLTLATLLLSTAGFVIGSYLLPMLACKMHGYGSQCMFNPWQKEDTSVGEWLSGHLPDKFGGGFHDQDW